MRKECSSEESACFEAEYLRVLKQRGVAVPGVIGLEGRVVKLEYIEGLTLPDFLADEANAVRCSALAMNIASWFESFYAAVRHASTGEIRGDVNGRNFIVTKEDAVFGVDFESRVFGKRETDLGRLLAFVKTYTFDNKKTQESLENELDSAFLRRFSLSSDALETETAREIREMAKRRR